MSSGGCKSGKGQLVVKVQMALYTSDGLPRVLIYDREREIWQELEGEEALRVIKMCGLTKDRHKGFFKASFDERGLKIGECANWQDW